MIKLVDLIYHSHVNYTKPQQVVDNHAPALSFATYLKNKLDFVFVKHAGFEQHIVMGGIPYYFFKGGNKFWSVTIKTHRFIKTFKPDIVLVQGLIFPVQVMFLRLFCGKKFKLIIQHHGELPAVGLKGRFEKIACSLADGFFFTSAGNVGPWKQKGTLAADANIYELLEASTNFKPVDKLLAKAHTGVTPDVSFIWVGHLNANKDPLTALTGFAVYLQINPAAKFYMIYQTETLLNDVKQQIASNALLTQAVILVGKVPNAEMPYWFSAVDYYLSASHKEGSGYALLEAMACGCIPVVTNIPSYQKITVNGQYGFLYPAGDSAALAGCLKTATTLNREEFSADVLIHFTQNLSFQTIANDLVHICRSLLNK